MPYKIFNSKVILIGSTGSGKTGLKTRLAYRNLRRDFFQHPVTTLNVDTEELDIIFNDEITLQFTLFEAGTMEGYLPTTFQHMENPNIVLCILSHHAAYQDQINHLKQEIKKINLETAIKDYLAAQGKNTPASANIASLYKYYLAIPPPEEEAPHQKFVNEINTLKPKNIGCAVVLTQNDVTDNKIAEADLQAYKAVLKEHFSQSHIMQYETSNLKNSGMEKVREFMEMCAIQQNHLGPQSLRKLKIQLNKIFKSYINPFKIFNHHHNERARQALQAINHAQDVETIKKILENQKQLFEQGYSTLLLPEILSERWSEKLKNPPKNPNDSGYYKSIMKSIALASKTRHYMCEAEPKLALANTI